MNYLKKIKTYTKFALVLSLSTFTLFSYAAVKLSLNDSNPLTLSDDINYIDNSNSLPVIPNVLEVQINDSIICTGPNLESLNSFDEIILEIKNGLGQILFIDQVYGVKSAIYDLNSSLFKIQTSANVTCGIAGNIYVSDIIFKEGYDSGDIQVSIVDTSSNHNPITDNNFNNYNQVSIDQQFQYIIKLENKGNFSIDTNLRDNYPQDSGGYKFYDRTWECNVVVLSPSESSYQSIGESCGFGTKEVEINNLTVGPGETLYISTKQRIIGTSTINTIQTIAAAFIQGYTNTDDDLSNNVETASFKVISSQPPVINNLKSNETLLEDSGNYALTYSVVNSGSGFSVSAHSSNEDIVKVISSNGSPVVIRPQANRFGNAVITINFTNNNTVVTKQVDIEVIPVNDPPTFTLTDDGLDTIDIVHDITPPATLNTTQSNFISNISMGPNEDGLGQSNEQLEIQSGDSHYGQSSEMSIFSVAPYLDNNENLHYILSGNATGGKAYFKVRMQDDGGLVNGGFNASAKYFTIEVLPIKWQQNAIISGLESGNILEIKSANISNNIVITSNGTYNFPKLVDGSTYVVAVKVNPNRPSSAKNQTCLIGSGTFESGVITADINVDIICTTNQYSVSGKVYGMDRSFDGGSNSNLIIKNNSGDDITINANYTYNNNGYYEFTFPLQDDNSGYSVSLTNPSSPHQTCHVTDGAGIIPGANVTKVRIDCAIDTFTVGGTISGLTNGNDVGLKINGANGILRGNGSFIFPGSLDDLENYTVTISNQPNNQTCTITSNGSGAINNANITNVAVACN